MCMEKFKKRYLNVVLIDNEKDAMLISGMEGYGNVNANEFTNALLRERKVMLTVPNKRTYFGAAMRSLRYSKMGIMNCIIQRA